MKLVELNREKLIEQDMEPLTEVSTSEVYRLRREGKFDESYRMACELMKQPNSGERELKAYGYVLMSLIRRSVEGNDEKSLTTYVKEFEVSLYMETMYLRGIKRKRFAWETRDISK